MIMKIQHTQVGNTKSRMRGVTLPEMMVGTGVGSLVLMMIALVFASSSRSFSAIGNYISMDQKSRNALDQMTRDIRRAKDLITFSTNQLVFNYAGTTNLTIRWDPSSRQLVQWKTGDTRTNILLSECDSLQFSMYKNIPLPGGGFTNTTSTAEGKSISVAWKCSRTILGKKVDTEDMQQALIAIRNKPVL